MHWGATPRSVRELVPIVEPEVLMDGPHTIERCEEVTAVVLHAVFHALFEQGVALEGMLLKPNMVIAGKECPRQSAVEEVATATLRCLRRHVPAAVPGIVFLSSGQNARVASAHLNAINRLPGSKPWKVSFSYGRALQDPALEAGMAGTTTWRWANGLSDIEHIATERRVSDNTRMKWTQKPQALMIPRIVATGAMTDTWAFHCIGTVCGSTRRSS